MQSPKHVTGYNKNEKLYQCCEQYSCVLFLGQFLTYHSLLEFNNVVMYNFSFYKTKTSKTIKLANNKNLETLLQDTKDPLYEPNFVLKCYITTQWPHLRLIIKSNVRNDCFSFFSITAYYDVYSHMSCCLHCVLMCPLCLWSPAPDPTELFPGWGPRLYPPVPGSHSAATRHQAMGQCGRYSLQPPRGEMGKSWVRNCQHNTQYCECVTLEFAFI